MSRKKKKSKKNRIKLFAIIVCYLATFVLTSIITMSTMAWFQSSTWQSEILYMGGPVYIHFSDDSGNKTSGQGQLVTETPRGWTHLYPGMNINFEARAVVEGKEFEKIKPWNETITYYTTEAVLRAKITLKVTDPNGSSTSPIANEIYSWIWPQLENNAIIPSARNEGKWVMDELSATKQENYFYYCTKVQDETKVEKYSLLQVGGIKENASVDFLNNTIIQLPAIQLTNSHADCTLKFTILFEAVQAFFPYEEADIGSDYQGDTTDRSEKVESTDVGMEKPLTVGNSRKIFNESKWVNNFESN